MEQSFFVIPLLWYYDDEPCFLALFEANKTSKLFIFDPIKHYAA